MVTRWWASTTSPSGPLHKSYDQHPAYTFVRGDVKDTALMKLIRDCDLEVIAVAAMIGGISYFHGTPISWRRTGGSRRRRSCRSGRSARRSSSASECCRRRWSSRARRPKPKGAPAGVSAALVDVWLQKLAQKSISPKGRTSNTSCPTRSSIPSICVGIGERRAKSDKEILSGNVKLAMSRNGLIWCRKDPSRSEPAAHPGERWADPSLHHGGDLAAGIRLCLESSKAINDGFASLRPGRPASFSSPK